MTREEAINEIKSWAIPSKKGREVLETLIPELAESEDESLKNKSGYYKAGKFWKASTLWNATKNKIPQRVSNRYILQECTWNIGNLQDFANEVKNVQEVSLDYPIILDMNGNIIDGAHRVVRAYLEGKDVDIVYLGDDEWPEPDYDEEKAVKKSDDEKIRKSLIKFLTDIKAISESGRTTWAVRKEDAEMCKSFIAWLEKQKENPKSSDSIPADCTSGAKCEDERIRQWLYDLVDEGAYLCERPFATESILAYLEKQKEKLGDMSTILLVKKEIERRIETWQKSRKELIAMECNTLADDAAVRIEELYSLISFLGTIRCGAKEKQKEQKPVKCIDFNNEFENQVSHLLASVLNGEHEYTLGFVKHAAQSLLGYAKNEIKPELPLMGGDTDTYFDDLRMTTKPLTSREWFDEGIKYAQRLQKEQKPVPFSCGHEKGQQAEWSEEDEKILDAMIDIVTNSLFDPLCPREEMLDWLKSLRPSWKPSEEQMEALKLSFEDAFDDAGDCNRYRELKLLYEQLKKL